MDRSCVGNAFCDACDHDAQDIPPAPPFATSHISKNRENGGDDGEGTNNANDGDKMVRRRKNFQNHVFQDKSGMDCKNDDDGNVRTIFACQDTSGDGDGMVDNGNGGKKIVLVQPLTQNENLGVRPPVKKQVWL